MAVIRRLLIVCCFGMLFFFLATSLCVCVCVEPAQSIIQKDTFINVKRAQSVGFSTHTQTHIQYCQIQSAPESGCDDVTIFWFSRCVSVLCLCRHLPYFNVAWAWQHGPVPTSLSMIFFRVYNNLLMRWMMMMMCSCVCVVVHLKFKQHNCLHFDKSQSVTYGSMNKLDAKEIKWERERGEIHTYNESKCQT